MLDGDKFFKGMGRIKKCQSRVANLEKVAWKGLTEKGAFV